MSDTSESDRKLLQSVFRFQINVFFNVMYALCSEIPSHRHVLEQKMNTNEKGQKPRSFPHAGYTGTSPIQVTPGCCRVSSVALNNTVLWSIVKCNFITSVDKCGWSSQIKLFHFWWFSQCDRLTPQICETVTGGEWERVFWLDYLKQMFSNSLVCSMRYFL